jgi:eukaryotic-like serine/threonine-protein kinase
MRDHSIGTIRTVDGLLDELLDLEPAARERRLEGLRAEDAALAAEVERVLVLCVEEPAGLAPGGALDGSLARECLLGLGAVAELAPGTVIGPYQIECLIGKGGMSEVYRAARHFEGFSQPAALKLVRSDRVGVELRERLLSEQRTLVRLDHPNIARFLDAGMGEDGNAYLAMELIEGAPIAEYAGTANASLRTRLRWMIDLCKALAHAHAQLIVHCDIKPNNILRSDSGQVKIIDFGQSCKIGTVKERIQGTPDYIAPEQVARRPISAQTDGFNLGATLYWALTGRHIPTLYTVNRKGDNSFLLDARIDTPQDLNPKVPAALSNLTIECISTRPQKRPADMDQVIMRLELAKHILEKQNPLAQTG